MSVVKGIILALSVALSATVLLAALSSATLAAPFSCAIAASCNATQTLLMRLNSSEPGMGANNSHAQLANYSGTPYPYSVCCWSDASHHLNDSCAYPGAVTLLRAYDITDSHVQIGTATPAYNNSICLGVDFGNISCEYVNDTCDTNYTGVVSIASSEVNGGAYNQTNAHSADFNYFYRLKVCCRIGTSAPTVPVLVYPAYNNASVFERFVNFTWNASFDADGNTVSYSLNVTPVSGGCAIGTYQSGLGATNYTFGELCTDVNYNWTVRACDVNGCSAWATPFNFSVPSVVSIVLLNNNTNFGTIGMGGSAATDTGQATPFIIQNVGNVLTNVSLIGNNSPFTTAGLGTTAFQFKTRVNQTNAFNTTGSPMSYTPVLASYANAIKQLNYSAQQSIADVDINVTAPVGEPPGYKQGNLTFLGAMAP